MDESAVKIAFEKRIIVLPMSAILPLRQVTAAITDQSVI
jgi:hypothetical protein